MKISLSRRNIFLKHHLVFDLTRTTQKDFPPSSRDSSLVPFEDGEKVTGYAGKIEYFNFTFSTYSFQLFIKRYVSMNKKSSW